MTDVSGIPSILEDPSSIHQILSSNYLPSQPNFLHAGDHAQFGGGVSSERRTNPAVELHDLPRIDLILLSHYHGCVIPPFN